jgi:putative membrane protein
MTMINATLRSLRILGALSGFALLSAAWAQGDAGATKFLTDSIRSNIAEVKMSELALQRGKSKDVREFAETLVSDHTMSLHKTSALAKTLGVLPPTEPTADAIKSHEAMSKLSGDEFDRAFASHMVKSHEQGIAKYKEAARDGGNPDVAELANDTLPTLEKHLEMAQSLERKLGT